MEIQGLYKENNRVRPKNSMHFTVIRKPLLSSKESKYNSIEHSDPSTKKIQLTVLIPTQQSYTHSKTPTITHEPFMTKSPVAEMSIERATTPSIPKAINIHLPNKYSFRDKKLYIITRPQHNNYHKYRPPAVKPKRRPHQKRQLSAISYRNFSAQRTQSIFKVEGLSPLLNNRRCDLIPKCL